MCRMRDVPIAALFVQTGGAYFDQPGIDPWDETRDARGYQGSDPVVAHPPCQRWSVLARCSEKRTGRKPGEDGGCFASALASVRRCGGVLEHPAYSAAFAAFGLPRPVRGRWTEGGGGWVTEVSQVVYGHLAQKRTWLFYVGPTPPDLDWSERPGTHRIGGSKSVGRYQRDGSVKRIAYREVKPSLSQRTADATPPAFKALLISLARGAARELAPEHDDDRHGPADLCPDCSRGAH